MLQVKKSVFWFITGSQHLYGEEVLRQVDRDSQDMVDGLNKTGKLPYEIVFKPVVTTPESIRKICVDASADDSCAGIITWMHTFSPSKMWIAGLSALTKPYLHLHTQYNREIPWNSIDMDFMNLNQSAHGDREHGFIGARMGLNRKIVVGYWQNPEVVENIGSWMRVAVGYQEGRQLKVARIGDNMRDVAVTEGDKVEAQIKLGWYVDAYGIGDLVEYVDAVSESDLNALMDEYDQLYEIPEEGRKAGAFRNSIREQGRIELGMKALFEKGGYSAFTTNFQHLNGIKQLPGLAAQRLMAQGYGFGAEGDWKTAALVRVMKIMGDGLTGGTSLMEDYTYHLEAGKELILGAHMLEICPSIASSRPKIDVKPLGIGGKEAPARLLFEAKEGPAVCASLIDMGNRFRLIVNEVDAVKVENKMPNLPVASVLWRPQPSLAVAAEAWIMAGGAHHTSYSYDVTAQQLVDYAEAAGIECVVINKDTDPLKFRNELRWNEVAWGYRFR